MRVRSGFNSAVFFTVCGLLIAVIAAGTTDGAADGPLRDDPRCSVSLSMFLENSNGSFTHDGMVYPPDVRWTDGNFTYGCICRLRWCIRKCCRRGEVIRRDLRNRPLCEKVPREDFATNSSAKTPALHLAREQLAKEIRDISELREHFVLIEARGEVCPGPLFALNEDDGEEKVTLRANGDLLTNTLDKILRPWDYCIDWRMTLDKISILACVPPDIDTVQPSEQQNTVHKVGIIISIPFLIATFLVYAITPELRNLYGKTLMCYVICLITAYVFLILATYIYISPYFLCIGTVDDDNSPGKARLSLCCHIGTFLTGNDCVQSANETEASLPMIYEVDLAPTNIFANDDHFSILVWNPCAGGNRYNLNPHLYKDEQWYLLSNGSVYRPETEVDEDRFLNYDQYCLARVRNYDYPEYLVFFCEEMYPDDEEPVLVMTSFGMMASVPFLIVTFVVYWLLPELKNIHGLTLRGYVGCLAMAYSTLTLVQLASQDWISYDGCIAIAFIIYFSFLASFFWLNVMCFDIWWTFGGFRSLQGSVKQREKKKFIMYSIYAWGCASILTIICAIMDFVPNIPDTFIRPEFGNVRCWFTTEEAKAIYFYAPMSVTVICNICLFISTALKIVRHKKDTAHHLRGSESRRHDDNKQWFNLYLKLFIVMGINWSMEIISFMFKTAPPAVWYISDLTNTLQGLIIFIIFVWKDKIKKLLLKRFGCQERDPLSGNSTRSGCHSTVSRTCTTTMGVMPLQEKISPYVQTNCRARNSSDETDYP